MAGGWRGAPILDPMIAEPGGRRVLLVIGKLGPAGAESQLITLAIGLARRGDNVTLACITKILVDRSRLEDAGVRVVELSAGRRTRFLAVAALALLARRADVVHCTLWDASLWGRIAAVLARRPVIVTDHSTNRRMQLSSSGVSRGRWIALHNRALDRFTFATVACATAQLPLLMSEGVSSAKIVHIPNGLAIEAVEAAAGQAVGRDELGIPATARVVVHVARLQPVKNQRATLDMVMRLNDEIGPVHAVFVGDGRDRAELERQAGVLGSSWAHFLGRRSDVPALIALADLVVLPSMAEAMPMSIIEAIVVGVPVVATDVGDVRRVLTATGAGICVPAGDPEAFYAACKQVLTDAALRRELTANARAARPLFDARTMVERYATLFAAATTGLPAASLSLGSDGETLAASAG